MNVIVSRHAAAVEFVRSQLPEFRDAAVLAEATPEQVRGNVVAGNLPLHLAALCSQVVAVEFAGAPPRGAELTLADMEAAGAWLARYTVAAVPEPPKEITWSDGIGNRGRQKKLLVGRGDQLHVFQGTTIHGVVAVARSDYTKNGKWSRTDYTLRLAPGSWSYVASQSWEEGEWWHGCNAVADMVAQLRAAGCTAPDAAVIAFLEASFPKTVERVRASEETLRSVQ